MVLGEDGRFSMGLGPDVRTGTYEVTSEEGNVFETVMNTEGEPPEEIAFTLDGETLSGAFGATGRELIFRRD